MTEPNLALIQVMLERVLEGQRRAAEQLDRLVGGGKFSQRTTISDFEPLTRIDLHIAVNQLKIWTLLWTAVIASVSLLLALAVAVTKHP